MKSLITAAVLLSVLSISSVISAEPAGAPELVAAHSANLVFIADGTTGGAGSGFVCDFRGKPAFFTNIHVVAGMRAPQFTRLDKTAVPTVGAPSSAVGHDILHYSLPPATPLPTLRAAPRVEDVAAIGDDVFVLGNSEGARVIAPLAGKIAGIGPELVEVTAEFVPGNSGSPIIHAKSGMVIGIATYLSMRDTKFLSENSKETKVRRFGFRLDSVKTWQPVDWAVFARDRVELEKAQKLTQDLAKLLRDMRDGTIMIPEHTNPAIASHVKAFGEKVGGRVNPTDRTMAVNTFMRFMRSVSQTDIADAGSACATTTFCEHSRRKNSSAPR